MKSAGWTSFFLCVVMLVASSGIGCGGASNAATASPVVSTNSGTVSGQLTASPLSLNFGNVKVDGGVTKNVALMNSSNANVTITSASTSGPGFSLSGLSLPLDIAAGRTVSFSVSFKPSNSGQASGSVQLSSTAASPIAIALNGNGTTTVPHSVTATWNASFSPVAGYNVYRSTQSGGPYSKVNSILVEDIAYTDMSVTSGSTYFYVVTAVDAGSQESNFSNEAKATVPTP